jgi:hypothetical protein
MGMSDARERAGESIGELADGFDKHILVGGRMAGKRALAELQADPMKFGGMVKNVQFGYSTEHSKVIQRAQREAAKQIALDFQASFEVVGAAFRKMLPALRKLMPLLVEIEQEKKARVLAMRKHARRKGRKK